jgi:hypothetical protein
MLDRTLLTSDKKIKFKIPIGSTFRKKFRVKDKNKNIIDISTWNIRAQFVNNLHADDVICRLTEENDLIVKDPISGEITFLIPSNVTSLLKNYDTGRWSVEYNTDGTNWLVFLQGEWSAESTLLTRWEDPV